MAFLFRRPLRQLFNKMAAKIDKGKTLRVSELEGVTAFPDIRSNTKDDPYLGELYGVTPSAADATPTENGVRHASQLSEQDVTSTPGTSVLPERGNHEGSATALDGPTPFGSTIVTSTEAEPPDSQPPDQGNDIGAGALGSKLS